MANGKEKTKAEESSGGSSHWTLNYAMIFRLLSYIFYFQSSILSFAFAILHLSFRISSTRDGEGGPADEHGDTADRRDGAEPLLTGER